jgi:Domain of unknown function (DUF4328)
MSVITCPGCMFKLTLPESVIGQRVKCPKCEADFEAQPEAKLALDEEPELPVEPPQPPTTSPLDGAYSESGGGSRRTVPVRAMFCSECGTKLAAMRDLCPGCGLSLDEMEERRAQRRPSWPRWRPLPPIRGSLAIFGAILVPVGVVLFIVALILDDAIRRGPRTVHDIVVGVTCILAVAAELAALTCCLVWIYQASRLVARDDEDFSPGLKVGLLFVPVFNLYWMFVAIPGLSSAIQNELRYLAPRRQHNSGWVPGLIACILMLIPYFQPIAVCMFIAWMLLANNALHRLIRYHERLREESEAREG